VKDMIDSWAQDEEAKSLIMSAVPDRAARLRLTRLLRGLLQERVPITQWKEILAVFQESPSAPLSQLRRAARLRLREQLPGNRPTAKRIPLPQTIEQRLQQYLRQRGGVPLLEIPKEVQPGLLQPLMQLPDVNDQDAVLVTTSAELRPLLRPLVAPDFPNLMVMASEEIDSPDHQPALSR